MKSISRISGIINQTDYDRVLSLSDDECCFSLSKKEVAMLLSLTDYFGWPTRWYSEENNTIDIDIIVSLKMTLEYKLMSGCCPDNDAIFRYTEDGIYERSDDDGVTWTPAPDDDPRREWVAAPPLPGEDGDSKKCAAADNITAQFHIWADDLIEILEAGTLITAIAAAIVGFIASVVFASGVGAAWGVLLFSLAAALFAEGSSGFDDDMTEEVYEDFKCIVYCNMQEDGTFTEANIVAILGEIASTFDGIVEHFFYSIVSTMRSVGMSNTGTLGGSTASDCDDCGCNEGCAIKYRIWTQSAGDWGVIVASGVDWFEVEIAASGFAIVEAIEGTDCCEGLSNEVISGTVSQSAYLPCGTVWTPGMPFTAATIVDHCINAIEYQGTPGSIMRTTLTPCA